ncbi:MFS transporter [Insolitispirillum peregrinum]|nr:MFS transporter [Insolitispirillum peregrinum]
MMRTTNPMSQPDQTSFVQKEPASHGWRTPWVIVLCGCLISMVTFGVRSDYGLCVTPLSMTRGWGREVFAFSIALQNLLWGLGQPFAGALADRFGAARVLAGGGMLYAAGVVLTATATDPLLLHLGAGVMVGLGLSGAAFAIVIAGFTRLLPTSWRSTATGLATASGSLGQFTFAPLGQQFIDVYGWQAALVILAFGVALVPLLATALASPPKERESALQVGAVIHEERFIAAMKVALRHPSYLLLTAGFFVCGFHVAFITVHLPAYLADNGADPGLAAWSLSMIGLFNVIGAYGAGVLAGRWPRRWLLSAIYFGRVVAIMLFISVPVTSWSTLAFAGAMGLFWLSTVPPTSGLVAVMFGPRHMGMLFGIVFFSHQVGAFLGVWLGGKFYAQSHSYDLMWWISIALGLFATVVHLPIRERAAPTSAHAQAVAAGQ